MRVRQDRRSAHAIATFALALLASIAGTASGAETRGDPYTTPGLGTSTAPPWNPAGPISSERTWERVVRFPGRVVSYPIVLLARGAEKGLLYVEDTRLDLKVAESLKPRTVLGIAPKPASLGDATGVGLQLHALPPGLHGRLQASLSATIREYQRARLTTHGGPLGFAWQHDWRPGERWYGAGRDAPESGASSYALHDQLARAYFVLGAGRPPLQTEPPAAWERYPFEEPRSRAEVLLWAGPREARMTTGRSSGYRSIHLVHPDDAAATLHRRAEHFAYGARASWDARNGRPHWSEGWRVSLDAERYDRSLEIFALKDASTSARPFTRLTWRGEAGTSFGRDPRTFRLGVKLVDQHLGDAGGVFLLDDLASLGGRDLGGFAPGRFHDVDAAVAKLSYIFPLLKNVEFDVHGEAGNVYPDLGDLSLGSLETSAGLAMRFRVDTGMVGAVGLDASRESMRLRFWLGGVE